MQQTITKDQESSTNISLNDEVLKIFAKMPDALNKYSALCRIFIE
jgi:hypothetical protein